jgi:hypothetical protein
VAGATACICMWATKHSHNLTHDAGLASCSCSVEKKGRDTVTCLPKNAEKLTDLLRSPWEELGHVLQDSGLRIPTAARGALSLSSRCNVPFLSPKRPLHRPSKKRWRPHLCCCYYFSAGACRTSSKSSRITEITNDGVQRFLWAYCYTTAREYTRRTQTTLQFYEQRRHCNPQQNNRSLLN